MVWRFWTSATGTPSRAAPEGELPSPRMHNTAGPLRGATQRSEFLRQGSSRSNAYRDRSAELSRRRAGDAGLPETNAMPKSASITSGRDISPGHSVALASPPFSDKVQLEPRYRNWPTAFRSAVPVRMPVSGNLPGVWGRNCGHQRPGRDLPARTRDFGNRGTESARAIAAPRCDTGLFLPSLWQDLTVCTLQPRAPNSRLAYVHIDRDDSIGQVSG